MKTEHGLNAGDKIRLIEPEGTWTAIVAEVISSRVFTVESYRERTDVFVYGKEVYDFLTVDYEALLMLNISVTRELIRKSEIYEKEISTYRSENEELRTQLQALRDEVEKIIGMITGTVDK